MLLNINLKTRHADRERCLEIREFGLDERQLQGVLFRSLDRIFPDDELILLMQSARWREEPDLMAVDKDGTLYLFELKVNEAVSENLLQVLRYGQIFGASSYEDLDRMFRKRTNSSQSLLEAHDAKFEVGLKAEDFNRKQVFVVMTNGVDYGTRLAIQYWRSCGLDVRPWVYRVYKGHDADEMQLEISAFRVNDSPYEDLAEGYYILNTNFSNCKDDHEDMIKNKKAAAYSTPWKFKIENLCKGDMVFLYKSGEGVVALGTADGKLCKRAYHGQPDSPDEEYFMNLKNFRQVNPPLTARDIKDLTGVKYVFMQTMFGIDAQNGKAIQRHLEERLGNMSFE